MAQLGHILCTKRYLSQSVNRQRIGNQLLSIFYITTFIKYKALSTPPPQPHFYEKVGLGPAFDYLSQRFTNDTKNDVINDVVLHIVVPPRGIEPRIAA